MVYQQGDVLFVRVERARGKPVVRDPQRGVVFAEGEATGHAHVTLDEGVTLFKDGDMLYASADSPFVVVHEEHGRVEVPAGDYEIRRVREYDHFAEEARRVAD